MKTKEQLELLDILNETEISVSEEEYDLMLTLMYNNHDITVDWICWQMKVFNISFQEALIKYIIL